MSQLQAERRNLSFREVKDLDKLSYALTGLPIDRDLLQQYKANLISHDEIVDQLVGSDSFVNHFAKYWTGVLGIQDVYGIYEMMLPRKTTRIEAYLGRTQDFNLFKDDSSIPRDDPASQYESKRQAVEKLEEKNAFALNYSGTVRLLFKKCGDEIVIYTNYLTGRSRRDEVRHILDNHTYTSGHHVSLPKIGDFPTLSGQDLYEARLARSLAAHRQALDIESMLHPFCNQIDDMTEEVIPFWDKGQSQPYRAAKYLLDPNRCGPDLAGCFSNQVGRFPYRIRVGADTTLEPGRIIGKTVADRRNFKEVLTGSKTVMTGSLAHFLVNKMEQNYWDQNFPGGRYPESGSLYRKADPESKDLLWVERGSEHAGVLSTYAFHATTNGRRAKANRAYEAFTCKSFSVPEGLIADPNDDNPDLTKRQYCSACHIILEPMASFFNRWPAAGRVNFEFDDAPSIRDLGTYDGKSGKGIKAYGEILANSDAFKTCSVKRAFEFLHGRKFSPGESKVLLPRYVKRFEEHDYRLAPVIKQMLGAKEFLLDQGDRRR